MFVGTSKSAGRFQGTLPLGTASSRNLLQWNNGGNEPEQVVVEVSIDQFITAGTGTIPRMKVRYGHGLCNREFTADLSPFARFPLVASSISIDVYADTDSGTTPSAIVASAIVGPGDAVESQLVWTSARRVYDPEPAGYVAVPSYARRVRCLAGDTTPPFNAGVSAPIGTYLIVYGAGGATPHQVIPISRLLTEWVELGIVTGASGRTWNHYCEDATATTLYFRAQFGIL